VSAEAAADLRLRALDALTATIGGHQLTTSHLMAVLERPAGGQGKSTLMKLVALLDPECAANNVPVPRQGQPGRITFGFAGDPAEDFTGTIPPDIPRTPAVAALRAVWSITAGHKEGLLTLEGVISQLSSSGEVAWVHVMVRTSKEPCRAVLRCAALHCAVL
jgi:hypothetical protein